MAFLLTACVTSNAEPARAPEGAVTVDESAVRYVPSGVDTATGCTMYTKKPAREGIAVDAAIWYRATDGRFVIDAESCDPNAATVQGGK